MPADLSGFAVNTATLGFCLDLPALVERLKRHGFGGIAPWRRDFQATPPALARRVIADAGLAVTCLCRGSYLTFASEPQRRSILDDNRRALDEAAELGAGVLCMVVGGLPDGSKDLVGARRQVERQLGDLLDHAAACRVRLAIEPLHPMYAADRSCISTLGQALDIADALGPGVGVMIDAYHLWWDDRLAAGLERAGPERLLGWQICDWRVPTRDLLQDRGMVGDGVIDLVAMDRLVRAAGWQGLVEVEIFSALDWDQRPADETLDVLARRLRALDLRTASC